VRGALVAVVLALLSACAEVEPDDDPAASSTASSTTTTAATTDAAAPTTTRPAPREATIEGRVVDDDGQPVPGASVVVRRSPGIAERLTGAAAALFTAGIACVADIDVCDAESGVTARTVADDDGRFRLPLGREYIEGGESDTDLYVTASEPPRDGELTGPATTEELEVAQEVQTSPELQLWRPDLDVRLTPEAVRVSWIPLDPERHDDGDVSHALRFQTPDGDTIATLERSGDRLDARILEDVAGHVALTGRGDITVGPTIYHQTYEAPRIAFDGAAGAPPSRGRPCSMTLVDATPAPIDGCPLTDGDLVAPAHAPEPCAAACPAPVTDAVVDLGAPIDVDLVVVRACEACSVATSLDGITFTPFGSRGLARQAPRPVTARYVQLSATEVDRGIDRAAELSVWPAAEGDDGAIASDGTREDEDPSQDQDDDDGRDRTLIALIAAALLIAAAAAAGRARRRVSERR
jgi:hypothetical protein